MRACSILALAATLGVVRANDGWYIGTGVPTPLRASHPNIQMVSEDLKIWLGSKVVVDVTFVFKNHGPATKVTMGFPEHRAVMEEPGIVNFRSWVDGKRVRVTRKGLSADKVDRIYEAVWLKEVQFARNGSRMVRVRYDTGLSGNTSGQYALTYILKTAKSWRMPIEKFTITVDWTGLRGLSKPELHIVNADVKWVIRGNRRRTATIKNFTPKGDVALTLREGFWNFRVNGRKIPLPTTDHRYGAVVGSRTDPLFRIEDIGVLFGTRGSYSEFGVNWFDWGAPLADAIGGPFAVANNKLTWQDGRTLRLARGTRTRSVRYEEYRYVYLRDLVNALGGRMRYVASDERIDITIPTRKRP